MIKRKEVHLISCDGWNLEKFSCDTEIMVESDNVRSTVELLKDLGWQVHEDNQLLCSGCVEHLIENI